jgi:RimJ/RimL family protein N-acetyltransferase
MKTLILKKTRQHYRQPHWPHNDFVVLDAGKVVGRIMLHPQAPEGHRWFWTITASFEPSVYNRGYATTRLQAMLDFKARWQT